MDGISEVYIGTTYLSIEGLRILNDFIKKNAKKKDNVYEFILDAITKA